MSSTRISTSAMANTSVFDDDVLMSKEHKDLLRQHRDQLVDNMYPDDLLNQLQSSRILTPRDSGRIKERGSAEAMNECLLDILSRKPDRAFSEFLNALRETDQGHVANIIDKNRESTPKHKRDGRKNVDLSDEEDVASPSTSRKRKFGEIGVRLKTEQLEFDEEEDEEVETPRKKMTRLETEAREQQKERLKQELDIKLLSIIKKELRNLETVVGSGISESSMAKRKVVMSTLKDLQQYRREITSIDYGSVLFRLVCPTLYSLLQLRTLCTSGRLAALVEKIFTFDDFREYKLRKVHLSVSMDPKEFEDCQKELEEKEFSNDTKGQSQRNGEKIVPTMNGDGNTKEDVSSPSVEFQVMERETEDICRLKYMALSSPPHKSPDLEDWAVEAIRSLGPTDRKFLTPELLQNTSSSDVFRIPLRIDGRGRSPHRRSVRRLDDQRRLRRARASLSLSPLPGRKAPQIATCKVSRSQPGRLSDNPDLITNPQFLSTHTQPTTHRTLRQ